MPAAETLARTTVAPGRRARAQSGTLAENRRRARRPSRLRPCRRRGGDRCARRRAPGPDAWGATARFTIRVPARTGQVHRREGLGRARRHIPDGQHRGARPLHRIPHSAHARGDDLGRDAGRRRASTSRSTRWPATPRALRKRASRATDGASSRTIFVRRFPWPLPARRATSSRLPTQGRVLIVEARFYDDIADELLAGANGRA